MYADDTNTVIATEEAIEATLEWFELYGRGSGANLDKCNGLWLGAWRGRTDAPYGFTRANCLKINGVYFGDNSIFQNSTFLLNKIKKSVNVYKARNLTLLGKSIIINTVVCAQHCYIGACVILPATLINSVNKVMYKFLWNNNTECVHRHTFI